MLKYKSVFLVLWAILLMSNVNLNADVCEHQAVKFPYSELMNDDNVWLKIGNDGEGFNPMSHQLVFPAVPEKLRGNQLVDSLSNLYALFQSIYAMDYDYGCAHRFLEVEDGSPGYIESIENFHLENLQDMAVQSLLNRIRKSYIDRFYCLVDKETLDTRDEETSSDMEDYLGAYIRFPADQYTYSVSSVLPDYEAVHERAVRDTIYRHELLDRVISERDFQKRCILVRELAYSDYLQSFSDGQELVAVLDDILKSDVYSPLLGELWRIWRLTLQSKIFGTPSNDGPIYNLFYNDLRNRVAVTYLTYLSENSSDRLAYKEFLRLATYDNIIRNSDCPIGNNVNYEAMELIYTQMPEKGE